MRLLRRESNGTFTLHSFAETEIPAYAILSHRWGPNDEEVILQDLSDQQQTIKPGWRKLKFCADRVDQHGLIYFWIDTCCIDKTNLVELSESIISMFEWYRRASRCYVYLSDVSKPRSDDDDHLPDASWKSAFRRSQWFTRGWTLQELLAPLKVQFFSKEGDYLGDKESMDQSIHEITGIAIEALRGRSLLSFSIEDRMSWIESRSTTRGEDLAYCLLGIFDISMPVLYGEGKEKALARLRLEIDRFHRQLPNEDDTMPQVTDRKMKLDAVRQSLRFEEMDDRYRNIARHHTDTCHWFLGTAEYKSWLQNAHLPIHHGVLWIKGKPGSGKSTMTKFLFERHRKKATKILLLSFFFSARGAALEKSAIGLYRSLLLQLLTKSPTCKWLSAAEWSDCHTRQWTIRRLQDLLETVVLEFGKRPLMIFIDALDECPEAEVRDLISFFERLCKQTQDAKVNLRVCFSSRHYPHISIRRSKEVILETQDFHSDDIRRYVQDCLYMEPEEEANQIREEICRRASGVFMWVVLVVRILKEEYDHGYMPALRKKLETIPDDLHALFSDIILRDDKHTTQLSSCLKWIFHSLRPLTPEELYLVVLDDTQNVPMGNGFLPEENRPLSDSIRRYIISRSKGLAEITKTDYPKVQFIHESVRDFLSKADDLKDILSWLADDPRSINQGMTDTCGRYLHAIQQRACKEGVSGLSEYLPMDVPLLDYATNYLFLHAELAEENNALRDNISDERLLAFWPKAYNKCKAIAARNFRENQKTSLLYILSHLGCARLIRIQLRSSDVSNEYKCEGGYYRYPFFAALFEKHREALAAFFRPEEVLHQCATQQECQRCALDDDLKQLLAQHSQRRSWRADMTPFAYLLKQRHSLAARYSSLHDLEPLPPRIWRESLSMLADGGSKILIRLLWNAGICARENNDDVSEMLEATLQAIKYQTGSIKSQVAARSVLDILMKDRPPRLPGYTIVQIIMTLPEWEDYGELITEADIAYRGFKDQTILHSAIKDRHPGIADFVLGRGADPAAEDSRGWSALHYAAHYNSIAVIDSLTSRAIDVNAKNTLGETALHEAVKNDHRDFVGLLLSKGADANAKCNVGQTVLHEAVHSKNHEIVALLLENGARVNDVDRTTSTAPHEAIEREQLEIVCLLLPNGANINALDSKGRTPFQLAVSLNLTDIAEVILSEGTDIDINQKDGTSGSALCTAIDRQSISMVKLLVSKGAKFEIDKSRQQELLRLAIKSRCPEIVTLLLSRSPDNMWTEIRGWNPAQVAAQSGEHGIAEAIIKQYVRLQAHEFCGEPVLDSVVKSCNKRLIELVLSIDPFIDINSQRCKDLLHFAARYNWTRIVELLVAKDIDLNAEDRHGLTALQIAAKAEHPEIMRLLSHSSDRGKYPPVSAV